MRPTYVTLGSALFRLSGKAMERLLLVWFRSGERPDFVGWKGVSHLGAAPDLTTWTLADVERFMLATLRQDRDVPAVEGESAPADSGPVPEAAGRYQARKAPKGSLLELVDMETGDVVASGLTPGAVERMKAQLQA